MYKNGLLMYRFASQKLWSSLLGKPSTNSRSGNSEKTRSKAFTDKILMYNDSKMHINKLR